jgi:dipeptidyl-peptidase-4
LMFLSEATHLNKHLDYYPYVGSQHGVYGEDAVNLYQKLTEYFLNNL